MSAAAATDEEAGVERDRRSPDRPLKRLRQLQSRLDVLLRDSRSLRRESRVRRGDAAWRVSAGGPAPTRA